PRVAYSTVVACPSTPPADLYTLSLHDALPICVEQIIKLVAGDSFGQIFITDTNREHLDRILHKVGSDYKMFRVEQGTVAEMKERSEEHTSELQSRFDLVCRLLLEKKKDVTIVL